MKKVNKNMTDLTPYKVAKQTVWENPNSVKLKLDWNEETIFCDSVQTAIIDFIKNKVYNFYPDSDSKELVKFLSSFHDIDKDAVLTYSGSDDALNDVCNVFLNSKDIVTYRNPEYSNFYVFARSFGADLKPYFDEKPFLLNEMELNSFIKNNQPKIHYISNPNNPTGILYSKEFLSSLVKLNKNTLFVIDEAYIHFAYSEKHQQDYLLKLAITLKNIIIVRTFSKLFSLAGLRIGYLISNPENIILLQKIRKGKNVSMIGQIAALEALKSFDYYMSYTKIIDNEKNKLLKYLKTKDIIENIYESHTNFICMKMSISSKKVIEFLELNGIFVRDRGGDPQLENFIRVTIHPNMDLFYDIFDKLTT